jgi:hypothetical protein
LGGCAGVAGIDVHAYREETECRKRENPNHSAAKSMFSFRRQKGRS